MPASWTRHYDPEVPASLAPYPDKTLVDYVRENADARPDAPAILFKGTTISNEQLDRLSDSYADRSRSSSGKNATVTLSCANTAHPDLTADAIFSRAAGG